MSATPDPKWPVELVSINKVKPVDKWDSGVRITFRVVRNPEYMSFESTYTIPRGVDDADAIRLARNYFHRTMVHIGQQTSDWALTEEERKALIPAKEAAT